MRIMSRTRLSVQLLAAFLALAVIPMILLAYLFYQLSEQEIVSQTRMTMTDNMRQTAQLIDSHLGMMNEAARLLNIDTDLYNVFRNIDPQSDESILRADREIQSILPRYFGASGDIYSVHIVTSYYRFGETATTKNFYPRGNFSSSLVADEARKAQGRMIWIPTYEYVQEFNISGLESKRLDYRYLFSAVKLLKLSTVASGVIRRMDDAVELPILVVNFKPDLFLDLFDQYGEWKNGRYEYMVLDRGGNIIASTAEEHVATKMDAGWLESVPEAHFGSLVQKVDGRERIICYAQSEATGWYIALVASPDVFTGAVSKGTRAYLVAIALITGAISLFLFWLYSVRFRRRILGVLNQIKRIGKGDFTELPAHEKHDDFAFFYDGLNAMNKDIQRLIQDNYVSELRQRNLEILTLNVQLNPHFLYNTLNTINWVCRSGDLQQASEMIVSLSRMLYYTSDNRFEFVPLRDDLSWLKKYISIMQKRFENGFEVDFRIDDGLLEHKVPKLFLQPLVENSIVHGFEDRERGGLLEICGREAGGRMEFVVRDNGKGMTEEQVQAIHENRGASIGLSNVYQRLKMQYGNSYEIAFDSRPGSGTRVTVILPFEPPAPDAP